MSELFKAMAFGEDGLAGDSGSSPHRDFLIDATAESSFEELYKAWYRKVVEQSLAGEPVGDDSWSFLGTDGNRFTLKLGEEELDGLVEEEYERPAGFWLLTEESVEKVFLLELVEAYGDREGYVLIRAMKTIAHHLSTFMVGDFSVLKEDD